MNLAQVLPDIVKAVADASPLPEWNNLAAVQGFAVKLVPDLIAVGYHAAGLQAAHAECCALAPGDLESQVKAAMPVGKIGDGTILKWLVANLPAILQIITVFVPK